MGFSRQEHWSGLPFPSPMHESEKWKGSRSVLSNSSNPMDCSLPDSSVHGIFPGKSTGVGCHCLLQDQNVEEGEKCPFLHCHLGLLPGLNLVPGKVHGFTEGWWGTWFLFLSLAFVLWSWALWDQAMEWVGNVTRLGDKTMSLVLTKIPIRLH